MSTEVHPESSAVSAPPGTPSLPSPESGQSQIPGLPLSISTSFSDIITQIQSYLPDSTNLPLLQPPRVTQWTVSNVVQGLQLAYAGSLSTFRIPRTRKTLYKALFSLLLITTVLISTTHIIFFPFRVLHFGAHKLVKPILGQTVVSVLDWMMDNVDALVRWFIVVTPEAGLYLLRYVWPDPLDRLFFEALRGLTLQMALPNGKARFVMRFARTLDEGNQQQQEGSSSIFKTGGQSTGRRSWTVRLISYLNRYAKRIIILAALYMVSLVPLVGLLAWPAATFAYLGLAIGYHRAAWMCAVALISPPWWRFVKGPLLRGIWSFRALERELMEPYLCRSVMGSGQVNHMARLIIYLFLGLPIITLLLI